MQNAIRARIYRPSKSVMQSGRALYEKAWVLEYLPEGRIGPDALMGWQKSASTTQQVKVYFPTAEAAQNFAESRGIVYDIITPQTRHIPPKNYIQNFTSKVRTR